MSTAWRRVWINSVCRRGGRRSYQVCYWNLGAGCRKVARSFPTRQFAEEFAHRFSLWLNGAGPEPELAGAPPAPGPQEGPAPPAVVRPWKQVIEEWLPKGARRLATIEDYRTRLNQFATATRLGELRARPAPGSSVVWRRASTSGTGSAGARATTGTGSAGGLARPGVWRGLGFAGGGLKRGCNSWYAALIVSEETGSDPRQNTSNQVRRRT